jgi:hypothetical protein
VGVLGKKKKKTFDRFKYVEKVLFVDHLLFYFPQPRKKMFIPQKFSIRHFRADFASKATQSQKLRRFHFFVRKDPLQQGDRVSL